MRATVCLFLFTRAGLLPWYTLNRFQWNFNAKKAYAVPNLQHAQAQAWARTQMHLHGFHSNHIFSPHPFPPPPPSGRLSLRISYIWHRTVMDPVRQRRTIRISVPVSSFDWGLGLFCTNLSLCLSLISCMWIAAAVPVFPSIYYECTWDRAERARTCPYSGSYHLCPVS